MSGFVTDIEGGMDDPFTNEDGVSGAEDFFLSFDPLLDGALDAGDGFFLVWVLVKVVALARKEFNVDDGEILAAGGRGAAEPGEFSPIEFFGGSF